MEMTHEGQKLSIQHTKGMPCQNCHFLKYQKGCFNFECPRDSRDILICKLFDETANSGGDYYAYWDKMI